MKTRAAILTELNAPLEVADIEVPALRYGQVLVQIEVSGICGAQLNEIEGRKGPDKFLPHLLGHEASGFVRETGEGVKKVKAGDRVVLHWRKAEGLEGPVPRYLRGTKPVNAGWVTTFQELSVVSENRLTKVPDWLDHETGSLYGCCLTSAFGIVNHDAGVTLGQSALVLGAGGLGLAEVMGLKLAGASPIVAVDLIPAKLEAAKGLGATHGILASKEDVRAQALEIAGSAGFDVVIDNTGHARMIELAYELAGPRGKTILAGVPHHAEKVSIHTLPLHFGKTLKGSHGGDTEPSVDIPRYLKFQREGRFDPQKLISHRFSLEQINEAIALMKKGETLRCVIRMASGQ